MFIINYVIYRIAKSAVENVPIIVRKMSDHQLPSLSLIDKNKINGLVKSINCLNNLHKYIFCRYCV